MGAWMSPVLVKGNSSKASLGVIRLTHCHGVEVAGLPQGGTDGTASIDSGAKKDRSRPSQDTTTGCAFAYSTVSCRASDLAAHAMSRQGQAVVLYGVVAYI